MTKLVWNADGALVGVSVAGLLSFLASFSGTAWVYPTALLVLVMLGVLIGSAYGKGQGTRLGDKRQLFLSPKYKKRLLIVAAVSYLCGGFIWAYPLFIKEDKKHPKPDNPEVVLQKQSPPTLKTTACQGLAKTYLESKSRGDSNSMNGAHILLDAQCQDVLAYEKEKTQALQSKGALANADKATTPNQDKPSANSRGNANDKEMPATDENALLGVPELPVDLRKLPTSEKKKLISSIKYDPVTGILADILRTVPGLRDVFGGLLGGGTIRSESEEQIFGEISRATPKGKEEIRRAVSSVPDDKLDDLINKFQKQADQLVSNGLMTQADNTKLMREVKNEIEARRRSSGHEFQLVCDNALSGGIPHVPGGYIHSEDKKWVLQCIEKNGVSEEQRKKARDRVNDIPES